MLSGEGMLLYFLIAKTLMLKNSGMFQTVDFPLLDNNSTVYFSCYPVEEYLQIETSFWTLSIFAIRECNNIPLSSNVAMSLISYGIIVCAFILLAGLQWLHSADSLGIYKSVECIAYHLFPREYIVSVQAVCMEGGALNGALILAI